MEEKDFNGWLLFIYKVPTEPSTPRVKVWRKLKEMGALYIQQSSALLPALENFEKELYDLTSEIRSTGGEAYTFRVLNVWQKEKELIIKNFNEQRNIEYDELIEKCEDFLKEIQKETERKNFTFAELEENDEELDKLKRWFDKINKRDFFCAEKRVEALNILEKCERALREFSLEIYKKEGMV